MRVVQGLRRVELTDRPDCIPKARPRGLAAKGLTYERQVGKRLAKAWPNVVGHQWFRFWDREGPGFCQTDYYIVLPNQVLLIECKLTETPRGFEQIGLLYRPILSELYGLPVTGVMVCRNLVSRTSPCLIRNVQESLRAPGGNFLCLLLP